MSDVFLWHQCLRTFSGVDDRGLVGTMVIVFEGLIGLNVEVYVDNIVVKSESCQKHVKNLNKVLNALRKYNPRLNP